MGNISTGNMSVTDVKKRRGRRERDVQSVCSTVDEKNNINVVFYGAGETGKTTFAHSLLGLKGHEFKEEKKLYKSFICQNILEGVNIVVNSGMILFGKKFTSTSDRKAADRVIEAYQYYSAKVKRASLDEEVVEDILHLYDNCAVFKETMRMGAKFSLFESWFYFVGRLRNYPDWGGMQWRPNPEDILRCRNRTHGAKFFSLNEGNNKYTFIDLGGQQSERAFELQKFFNFKTMLFFASLTEYNEQLFEMYKKNRMKESVELFEKIVTSDEMARKPVILLLNKLDLFNEKYVVRREPINIRFEHMQDVDTPRIEDEEEPDLMAKALDWFTVCYSRLIPDNVKEEDIRIIIVSALDVEDVKRAVDQILPFLSSQLEAIAVRF